MSSPENKSPYEPEETHDVVSPAHNSSAAEEGVVADVDDLFGSSHNSETEASAADLAVMPKIPKLKNVDRHTNKSTDLSQRVPVSANDEPAENSDGDEPDKPVDPKQAEIDSMNKQIDAALKSGRARRRKRTDEDDASIDEAIVQLRKRMRDAAYRDIDDNKDRLPAVHKLAMLPDVVEELSKAHLYEAFLDNNITDSIRLWLEPLDDGSLPSLDIQNAMLNILDKLPVRQDHLRESGVGKIILFMSKCPRIPEINRRICEQFVQRWSRMVLGLSTSQRDVRMKEAVVSSDHGRISRPRARASDSPFMPGAVHMATLQGKNNRISAQIPRRSATDYTVMPVSNVIESQRPSARDSSDKYKRLKQVIAKSKRR
ncbi:Transcription factor iws1 [Coemansia sp. RSA 989]|nr:Transcription factor iws1 [Coemansia sp. RSA 989]